MSRTHWKRDRTPPWLIAITDRKHSVALVKSGPKRDPHLRVTLESLCGEVPPQWSQAGGYIVSLDVVTDLQCLAQHRGEYIVVRERRAD